MSGHDLIVIGASWGGLHALRCILQALPREFPLPVVIVQHRAADSDEDALISVVGRGMRIPVGGVCDKEKICSGRAYVAPSDYHLLVEADGRFALSTDERVQFSRPSIDVLFESAADACGERLVGVVLTGTGEDGAAGLKAVRRAGGHAIVQDPEHAERRAMPDAALSAAGADRVLALDEIGPHLATLGAVGDPLAAGGPA